MVCSGCEVRSLRSREMNLSQAELKLSFGARLWRLGTACTLVRAEAPAAIRVGHLGMS